METSYPYLLLRRYRIKRKIGQGGFGAVFLAEDILLENRLVALKFSPKAVADDPQAIQQVKREALLAMKLSHPNIVTLRAFESANDIPFLVMDYVEGSSLRAAVNPEKPMSVAEFFRLLPPIIRALAYAHAQRVIHRDLKPDNILLSSTGQPYLTDFGIAQVMRDTHDRVTGKVKSGTPLYMCPEQLSGQSPVPAHDIYSLGVTMYELLTGSPPFAGGDIYYQIIHCEPDPPSAVPKRLAEIILACMKKISGERPPTMEILLTSLMAASERSVKPVKQSVSPIVRLAGHPARSNVPNPFPGN